MQQGKNRNHQQRTLLREVAAQPVEDKFAPFYKMLEQSDGHTPASFIIEDWSEISENLSLSFEQLFNPSAYMDVKEVLKEAAEAQ